LGARVNQYRALKPIFAKSGDFYKVASWTILGTCTSMQDAKRKFGGYPILEKIAQPCSPT
jgi:hypothetical protein